VKVLVLGESCRDIYIYGACPRLSPEAPVPVFVESRRSECGGMALNVAANLRVLGVACELVTQAEPIHKTRFVEDGRNHTLLRVDNERPCEPYAGDTTFTGFDAVALVDYNKGFLPVDTIAAICERNTPVFLDTKKPLGAWCHAATFLKLNEVEERASASFLAAHPAVMDRTIVTLGGDGCLFQRRAYPVAQADVMDVAGAGDTFFAGLIAAYLTTRDTERSLTFANECARDVVQRRGTVVVRPGKLSITL
jgi:bifunctional ADP-heptose synthase (sugar kinase/adenylyltransferase)